MSCFFVLLLAAALPDAAHAQVRLTDVVTFGADISGSVLFQPDVWETRPGGNFDNWLQSLPSGTFLNGPSDAAVQPNITLVPGTNSFRVYTSPGIDNANFGINLFFNGAQTPSISAFGPMLTNANQVHSFAADSASPTPTPVPVLNSGISGAGTLTFETSNQVITLMDFYLATPSVFNLDQASQMSLGPDGVMDYVGGFTLVVSNKNSPPDCTPPPAGLVAWWPGEGNANDAAGTNHGAPLNIAYADGEVGQAFVFNGSSSMVQFPASPSLDVGQGGGLTVEAWINPENLNLQALFEWNQNNGIPYGAGQIGTHMEINESNGDGSLWGNVMDTSGMSHNLNSSTGIIVANQFQHVAMTYDKASGAAVLYCNGVMVATNNIGTIIPQTSFDLFLGNRPSGFFAGDHFQGEMDEPSVYNRALSGDEIAALYNAGSGGKCQSSAVIAQQPANQTTVAGSGATLTVGMGGTGPFTYQWRFNGTNISGATNATLTLANLHGNQAGHYSVVITTPGGTLISSDAIVTVIPQDILVYNYSGKEQITTFSQNPTYNYSGEMLLIPAGTNGTFVGWATINGKKQYWVSPFNDYLWINIAHKNSQGYTVIGRAGDGIDTNGYPHLWSSIHRGVNSQLAIAKKRTFSFPNTFTCVDNHIYPDTNTGNIIMVDANSSYQFAPANTQTANNAGQTLPDLLNALTKSLEKQGYQKQ